MAIKNRDEVSALIQAQAAVVGETEYKTNLDTDMTKNIVFRKDVSDTDTATAATKTLDFLDIDYIEVAQNVASCAYTLNNIQQGEIKFLKITKTANQAITFAVGTDVSIRQDYIDTLTSVIYRITNKDGNLYIESISVNNDKSDDMIPVIVDIGDWNMDADQTKTVIHGISDMSKVRTIDVIIRDDTGTSSFAPLNRLNLVTGIDGGITGNSTVATQLARTTGGGFDSTSYDSTSFNRGWITYWFIP